MFLKKFFKLKNTPRLEICEECPSYSNHLKLCRECGCYMPAKTLLPNSTCPLKKW